MGSRSHTSRIVHLVLAILLLLGAPAAAVAATGPGKAAHAARHHRHHHRKAHHAVSSAGPAASAAAPAASAAPAGSAAPPAGSAAAPVASTRCGDGDLVPTSANLDRVRAAAACLVNQQRAAQGLGPLHVNSVLEAAAQRHSNDMVANNYFDHLAPSGAGLLDRVLAVGYAVVAGGGLDLGENLAVSSGPLATPAATVAGWMASPGHRANILNPAFTDSGIGVVAAAPALLGSGGQGATYTQDFGAAG